MSDVIARALALQALNPELQGKNLDLVVDVKRDFGASGSSQITLGTISAGSNVLTLQSPIDFKNGQGISIYGAGASVPSQIGPPSSFTVTQVSGSSSFTQGETVYVGLSYVTNTQETGVTIQQVQISSSGNQIQIETEPLPIGVCLVGVYVGNTSNVKKLGNAVLGQWPWVVYSGGASSGLSCKFASDSGFVGIVGPYDTQSGGLKFVIQISDFASASGDSPQPNGTTANVAYGQPSVTNVGRESKPLERHTNESSYGEIGRDELRREWKPSRFYKSLATVSR